jgi:hypothetical protein
MFCSGATLLLQLRVLCPGFLKDGDLRIGIFPEAEEIPIGGFWPWPNPRRAHRRGPVPDEPARPAGS